jgi:hypothetical protein
VLDLMLLLLLVVSACYGWLRPNTKDSWLSYIFIYLEFVVSHTAACWLLGALVAIHKLDEPRSRLKRPWLLVTTAAVLQTVLAAGIYLGETPWQGDAAIFDGICWFERTGRIFGGGSLLLPAALVAFAVFALTMASLKRLYVYRCDRVPWPGLVTAAAATAHASSRDTERVDRAARRIDQVVSWPLHEDDSRDGWGASIAVGATAVVYLGFLMWRTSPIPEGRIPSVLFWASLAAVMFVWVFWLRAIVVLWQAQRELHKALAEFPFARIYRRLPPGVPDAIQRFFWTRSRRDWVLGLMCAWREELRERYPDVSEKLGPTWANLDLPAPAESGTDTDKNIVAAGRLWPMLNVEWAQQKVRQRFLSSDEGEPPPGALGASKPPIADERAEWIELAEDFMALYFVPYVSQFLRHWWNLVVWLMVASLLLLVAMASYPFEPQDLLIGTCAAMIVLVGASALFVEVQMEWDALLSQMMGTRPNRIDWNSEFVVGLLTWILPVGIVLFAKVFPGAWTWFGGVLQNFTRTLG